MKRMTVINMMEEEEEEEAQALHYIDAGPIAEWHLFLCWARRFWFTYVSQPDRSGEQGGERNVWGSGNIEIAWICHSLVKEIHLNVESRDQ